MTLLTLCSETALSAGRRTFDTSITVLRFALTRGLQFLLPFWYAREPMFWLPYGWFPKYAEWLVSFPRAPRGSVSITSWQLACTGVLVLLKDTILALVALVQESEAKAPTKEKKEKEAPVAAESAPKEKKASGKKAATAGKDEL